MFGADKIIGKLFKNGIAIGVNKTMGKKVGSSAAIAGSGVVVLKMADELGRLSLEALSPEEIVIATAGATWLVNTLRQLVARQGSESSYRGVPREQAAVVGSLQALCREHRGSYFGRGRSILADLALARCLTRWRLTSRCASLRCVPTGLFWRLAENIPKPPLPRCQVFGSKKTG